MRGWFLAIALSWLLSCVAVAQTPEPPGAAKPRDPGALARGMSIMGVTSAALLVGGSVAIAVVDDVESERITRGVWVSALTVTAPLIAVGAWTARKRGGVEGYKQLRVLGWTAWTFTLANGVLQWVEAFKEESQPPWLTIGVGGLATLALLPLSLDAFVSARRAHMRKRFRIAFVPILQF